MERNVKEKRGQSRRRNTKWKMKAACRPMLLPGRERVIMGKTDIAAVIDGREPSYNAGSGPEKHRFSLTERL